MNSDTAAEARSGPHAVTGRACAFRLHALLLVVVVVEALAATAMHRDDEDLRAELEAGTPERKVAALFVLTNRGVRGDLDESLTQRLLASEDELVREWTMTANFVRQPIPPRLQNAYIASLGGSAEAERCEFMIRYRPGMGHYITLAALRTFLDAAEGGR